MSLIQKIKDWYEGEYIPPPRNDPNDSVIFISPGHYEQPLLAKMLGGLGRFWLAHWQWIVGTSLIVVGFFVAT